MHCMFEMWVDWGFVQREDQFFVFVPEIAGNEPQYSVGRLAAYPCFYGDWNTQKHCFWNILSWNEIYIYNWGINNIQMDQTY